MQKTILLLALIWISTTQLVGCASSKSQVFGDSLPTMKAIHDRKFHRDDTPLDKPERPMKTGTESPAMEFQWLPNPTLTMYVFKHLTPAGHPVPGYTTFFKLYIQDHIAQPGELGGWE